MTQLLIFDLKILVSRENIRRKCNPIVDLSKFTFNKKILNEIVSLVYNQVYCQSLIMLDLKKFRVVTIFLG